MLELFQTEWCPASRRVRQRLTELDIDYVSRQVPVEREARAALREAVGAETIPALRLENGSAVVGEENILAYLGEHVAESLEAEAIQRRVLRGRRGCSPRRRRRSRSRAAAPGSSRRRPPPAERRGPPARPAPGG